jgi:GGDEF domain-containing protein
MSSSRIEPARDDSSFASTFMPRQIDGPAAAAKHSWLSRLLGLFSRAGASAGREAGLVNPGTGLYSERGLLELGARMSSASQQSRQPLTLVVLSFRALDTLRGGRSGPAAEAAQVIARRCLRLAGIDGLAARTGPSEFTLLMPNTTLRQALATCRLDLGPYPFIALDIRSKPMQLKAGIRAAVVAGNDSVAPALAMVRRMQPLKMLPGEPAAPQIRPAAQAAIQAAIQADVQAEVQPAAQAAERKALLLEDRYFPQVDYQATIPTPLPVFAL